MKLEYERLKGKNLRLSIMIYLMSKMKTRKIVMHDIKRHLNAIKSIAKDKAVTEYIDDFIEDFSINKSVDYCNNPMVNSIVNRYKSFCDKFGVKMNIDIRSADFSFMSEPDITALLDNLLENAVEAAQKYRERIYRFFSFRPQKISICQYSLQTRSRIL